MVTSMREANKAGLLALSLCAPVAAHAAPVLWHCIGVDNVDTAIVVQVDDATYAVSVYDQNGVQQLPPVIYEGPKRLSDEVSALYYQVSDTLMALFGVYAADGAGSKMFFSLHDSEKNVTAIWSCK